jgi:hypothetical protein
MGVAKAQASPVSQSDSSTNKQVVTLLGRADISTVILQFGDGSIKQYRRSDAEVSED